MKASNSTDPNDYDVLIRRRDEAGYAAYCPQLAYMIKGTAHVEVEEAMKAYVLEHIRRIQEGGAQ